MTVETKKRFYTTLDKLEGYISATKGEVDTTDINMIKDYLYDLQKRLEEETIKRQYVKELLRNLMPSQTVTINIYKYELGSPYLLEREDKDEEIIEITLSKDHMHGQFERLRKVLEDDDLAEAFSVFINTLIELKLKKHKKDFNESVKKALANLLVGMILEELKINKL